MFGVVRWMCAPRRRVAWCWLGAAGGGGPLAMAHLYKDTGVKSLYSDRKFMGGRDGWQDAIEVSTTLYIGNLSFYTTEEQVPHAHSAPPAARRRVTSTAPPQPGRCSLTLALALSPRLVYR